MTHLKPAEIVDAAEGRAGGRLPDHLRACTRCREKVQELVRVLGEVRAVPSNEPSPLFWDHLSENIRERVSQEPVPAGAKTWIWAPATAIAAALAVAIGVSSTRLADRPQDSTTGTTETALAGQASTAEGAWGLVSEMGGELGWDDADAAGLSVRPGAADYAAVELSEEQQEELARLLQQELARLKS